MSTLRTSAAALLLALATFAMPALARAQAQGESFVRGYGGATVGSTDFGGGTETAVLAGGGVGVGLSRHFAVIADAGYISTIASEEANDALDIVASLITLVSGIDAEVRLKAPTFYAMGGARYTFGSGSARVRPFVEGEAGIARSTFSVDISAADSTLVRDAEAIFNATLGHTSATAPVVAAGGGLGFVVSERAAIEAGYRYLRLFGDAKADLHQAYGGVRVTF